MGRSKPRYAPVVDTPFVKACQYFKTDPFTVETCLVAAFTLTALKMQNDNAGVDQVEGFLAKALMRAGDLPNILVGIQSSVAVD